MKMKKNINQKFIVMKKMQIVFFIMVMVMTIRESYGQFQNITIDSKKKLVISDSNQSDFNSILIAPIESDNQNDSIKLKSILPKEIIIDPALKGKDFYIGEAIQYNMPIKKLNGNHTMQIYIPDSTDHYTLQIKELGIGFDGNRR